MIPPFSLSADPVYIDRGDSDGDPPSASKSASLPAAGLEPFSVRVWVALTCCIEVVPEDEPEDDGAIGVREVLSAVRKHPPTVRWVENHFACDDEARETYEAAARELWKVKAEARKGKQ